MQRVLQRAERAALKAARKAKQVKKWNDGDEGWTRTQNTNRLRKSLTQKIQNTRASRKLEWEAGSLAPRRDVGENKDSYGSTIMWDSINPELPPNQRPKWWHITEGDRAVVIKGRDIGKIGVVKEISEERGTVRIKGVAEQLVSFPEWMVAEEDRGIQDHITTISKDILLENVRLVHPLPDPKTGVPRDVIIDRLIKGPNRYDENRVLMPHDRLVPGANAIIPWPEKADPEHTDHEADTIQAEVEYRSYTPSLVYPPIPTSVIDELRNKFSKFRTRHDWEYIDRKEKEDATSEKRKELVKGMRTPLQELADLRAEQKSAAERELSDEQLEKIGAVIAKAQGLKAIAVPRIPMPE